MTLRPKSLAICGRGWKAAKVTANGFANEIWRNIGLAAEIPWEWTFATKFANDCECDGLVHSAPNPIT